MYQTVQQARLQHENPDNREISSALAALTSADTSNVHDFPMPVRDKPIWKGTVLSRNAKGSEDAYAIGVDGYVWTYQIDGVTGRTGRLMCTWLKASAFALATLSSGRALLVGGQNGTLSYVQELGDSSIWWTRPVTVALPVGMSQCQHIDNIRARWSGGVLYVVVDTCHAGAGGECLVQTWESVWDCQGMKVQPSPWRLRGTVVSKVAALSPVPAARFTS